MAPETLSRTDYQAALEEWLSTIPSANTLKAYSGDMRAFVAFLGSQELNEHAVAAWFATLLPECGQSTVQRKLCSLRSFCSFLRTRQLLRGDPTQSMSDRLPASPHVEHVALLTREKCQQLLDAPQGEAPISIRDRAILRVLADTACKTTEVVTVRREDYHWGNEIPEVVFRKNGSGMERTVPITQDTYLHLNAWMEASSTRQPDNAIFYPMYRDGSPRNNCDTMTTRSIGRIVEQYVRTLGWTKEISPESLRFFAIRTALERGFSREEIMEWAGYANLYSVQVALKRLKEQEED